VGEDVSDRNATSDKGRSGLPVALTFIFVIVSDVSPCRLSFMHL
jgi:hypothetical protein